MSMKVGKSGKQLFKEWEGLETSAYYDSGGALTIGIGHLITPSEKRSGKIIIGGVGYKYRYGLTKAQCWALLDQDLDWAENCVNKSVKVKLNQNQFDCLVSFTFNVGKGAFRNSTLLKLLNKGKYKEVPSQLMRWVYDNGVKVKGLVNRRKKEIALWNAK